MRENDLYSYLDINEIDAKAKEENIKINFFQLTEERAVFFPAWTFSLENEILRAQSSYDAFSVTESDYDKLVKKAEQQALVSALKNSADIKKDLYIYLLYRLNLNWVLNSIVFDCKNYAWKIHLTVSGEKICWDKNDKFVVFESTEYIGKYSVKPKTTALKIPLDHSVEIAEKVVGLCFRADKTLRGRPAAQDGEPTALELHPEDKKRLDEAVRAERSKDIKRQMTRPYEGFAFEEGARCECSVYYKRNGKLIVAYGSFGLNKREQCQYYYICSETDFETWAYPEERSLTTEEKKRFLFDMQEYNKNNVKKTVGFVKPPHMDALTGRNKGSK